MKTKQKILLDRILGTPMVLFLGFIARAMGRVLRRDHTTNQRNVHVILVAKFLGMGSILQATPMMKELKRTYPNARLIMLSTNGNKGLLERLDFIDEWVLIDDKSVLGLITSTVKAVLKMQRRKIDLYFDLEVYSALSCIVSVISLARNRYSFYRQSAEFKRGISTHLMYFNTRRPVRMIYLQLGRLAGISSAPPPPIGPIQVRDADRKALRQKLRPESLPGSNQGITIVNPNASDLMLERRWPAENYASLMGALLKKGRRVAIIGAPNEKAHVQKVLSFMPEDLRNKVIDTTGNLSLGELFALLESAECVITNDSGPMHMSVAVGTPTICLFGPVDPTHYGFDSESFVETIYKPVYCSPCVHEVDDPPCGGNNVCMQIIPPSAVIEAYDRLMARLKDMPDVSGRLNPIRYADLQARPLGRVVLERSPLNTESRSCEVCGSHEFIFLFDRDAHHYYRCSRCRLERTDPQPSDETLASIYGKHYYDAWGLDGGEKLTQSLKQAFFRKSIALLKTSGSNLRLLDCGAATGYLMEVAKKMGYDVYGNELSEFGATTIEQKFGNGRAFQGPFEDVSFPALGDAPFDVITMFDFIEHVRDPESVLRKAHSLLKPNGRLLICTPNAGSYSHGLMGKNWLHYKTEHIHYFAPTNLDRLLKKTGYREIRPFGAWKVMNLHYIAHQLNTYKHWFLTPLINLVVFVFPFLKKRNFPVMFGEMILIAKKA